MSPCETEGGKQQVITAGVVKGGVVIPNIPLPENATVVLTVIGVPIQFTPEEQEEFAAWDRLSDGALDCILKLEQQEAKNEPR